VPSEEKMSIGERRKYLKLVLPRYERADRVERGQLLTEMAEVTQLHRKSLVRLMNAPSLERSHKKRRPRGTRYGAAVADVVRVVWESLDYICAERMTPALLGTARQLAEWEELVLTPELEESLGAISRSTVQRLLQRFGQDTPRLPRRKPQPPNRLLRDIPMGRLPWETEGPGAFETDLVHHCGPVAAGEYVHTLQLVDIATGWSERVAILGRTQEAMVKGFRKVQERLPFPIVHLHPDNGSEFFNDHLIRYFGEKITGLSLSRSRPYRKNDNRFVEQKNSSLVRAYVGYDRLEASQCDLLNVLYDKLWLYYNLFQPVMHMVAKDITRGKVHRRHDTPRTPYQRLLSTGILSPRQKQRLASLYAHTNPRTLRMDIYQTLEQLWKNRTNYEAIDTKEAALSR
jgi:hypothetical protein